jgi:Trk K+ transport system NAD-binding subunit
MMDQPFILCGLGRIGWRALEYLQAGGFAVVAIDNTCSPDDPRLGKATLVHGDCRRPDVLEGAGVRQARGVLIVTSDDVVNITTALGVRSLNPDVRIVIRMVNENLINRFGKAVANVHALSLATLVGPVLARTALSGQALGTFRVGNGEEGNCQVSEVAIQQRSSWLDRKIQDLAVEHSVVVLAHLPATGKPRIMLDVEAETYLAAGDRLIVCGQQSDVMRLLAGIEEEILPHVLWASFLRRNLRALWRTVREIDPLVRITTAVLVGVIAVSTLILHLAGENRLPPSEAFYRTVSLMATGGEMHVEEYGAWARVFAAFLRIAGAAIVAAFTAIVTNYLLRAHLGGAFEVRRIPDSGHLVVCGLGTIGFRVVQELKAEEESVVVVERASDNPLIGTVRGLWVPVIVGDATVPAVLQRAHTATARAVIAATTNDLVNLEIALLVRENNPLQRVVPCLADANLAQSIREAANVRLTVSIPALAAPAFVASLFGDKVHCVFMLERRLLAAVDLTVQPLDTWLSGQAVRAIAIDYRMVPIAVFGADGKRRERFLDEGLEPGWRLVGILALPDLERLFRREPLPQDWSLQVAELAPEKREILLQVLQASRDRDGQSAVTPTPSPPGMIGAKLTRGQAEHLRALLAQQGIACELAEGQRDAGGAARPR